MIQTVRGFFGIAIEHPKHEVNIGGLWRSAWTYGASFIATVGRRYSRQASDTPASWKHIPLLNFRSLDDLVEHLPYSCPLVGIELDPGAKPLDSYWHHERAMYLLGAEDHGLTKKAIEMCHELVYISTPRPQSLNVASAGSIILADRYRQRG